jgi:signal transduction histidine kinase
MSSGATSHLAAVRMRRAWPLLPLAPAVVVVVGLAVAIAIGIVGVDHLARASDEHAADSAALLADVLAARLAHLQPKQQLEAMRLTSRRTGAELVMLDARGRVVLDASLGAPDRIPLARVLAMTRGEAITGLGRTRFAVRPLGGDAASGREIVAFVREPTESEGAPALISALLALTTLLVGVAATVAYLVARDANTDVGFVTHRVQGMARVRSEPTGEPVPVRTMDEVGALTSSFNELVGRFGAAERSYHYDLERARAADRDRAAFLAAVSHELRSPLNAILGFADVLMTEVDGPLSETAREEVEQIRGSGQHLADLINDILEFSAIESGTLKLQRSKVDLLQVAREVVREAAVIVGDKPISLRLEGDGHDGHEGPPVYARADPRRVRQILTNLVGNAIKFTQQGEVVITATRDGYHACIRVRDTGPGISPAERAVIFEEYKQAGEERARRRGTGLGLAIARRLVLMHGGTIRVESEVGHGSTFFVSLPAWYEREGGPGSKRKVKVHA